MALYNRLRFLKNGNILNFNFSTSYAFSNKWRRQQGLEPNPTQYGPLTNLPDYSFVDGRPTPLSVRKKRKIIHQQELCKKIVELTQEVDTDLENYYKNLEAEKLRKETIIKNKLKAKGNALLQQNKKVTSNS